MLGGIFLMEMKMKDKLWVFDTQQYLEIYASTLEEAQKQVREIEKKTGLEFTLHWEWETYQKEVHITGPCTVKYSPDKPLFCGAEVWINTESEVEIIE